MVGGFCHATRCVLDWDQESVVMQGSLDDPAHQPYIKNENSEWIKKHTMLERTLPAKGPFERHTSHDTQNIRHSKLYKNRQHADSTAQRVVKPNRHTPFVDGETPTTNHFAPPDEGGGQNYPFGRGLLQWKGTRVIGFEENSQQLITDNSRNSAWRGMTSLAQEHKWKGSLRAGPVCYEPCSSTSLQDSTLRRPAACQTGLCVPTTPLSLVPHAQAHELRSPLPQASKHGRVLERSPMLHGLHEDDGRQAPTAAGL